MYVFAELLRGFRNREGISQKRLAEAIGVQRSTLSNWENGNYLPRDISHVYQVVEVLNLLPEDADSLLIAANPDNHKLSTESNDGVLEKITIDSGQIEIIQDDISTTIELINNFQDSITTKNWGRKQTKKMAEAFTLLERRKMNPHLCYDVGDISYWCEQELGPNDLLLQFAARKVVLDAADRCNVLISDQGTLSWVSTRIIPRLK